MRVVICKESVFLNVYDCATIMFSTAILFAKVLRKVTVSTYQYTGMLIALLEFQCEYNYVKFIGERNASRNGKSESKHS